MLDDAFQASTDAVLNDMALRPRQPKPQAPAFSIWSTMSAAPRGTAAGAAEVAGSTADLLGAFGDIAATTEASSGGMFAIQTERERKESREAVEKMRREGADLRQEGGALFRNVARDYMPDPVAAHGAEMAVAELFRLGTKAVGSAALAGPVAGAALAGAEEGFTAADKLAEEGVDLATRSAVGAVTGALTGAGFALPVAGTTWKATVGLALAGGPVSFTAQQAATREILERADYSKQAQQYDPFDPVGLALSTVLPLGFGAVAMRGAARGAGAAVDPVAAVPAAGDIADEATVDAARVSLLREVSDAHRMTAADDLAGAALHQTAIARAIDQMAEGHRVQIEDVLGEPAMARAAEEMTARLRPLAAELDVGGQAGKSIDPVRVPNADDVHIAKLAPEAQPVLHELYGKAAREKPEFDAALDAIARAAGGTLKAAPLKGSERATAKIVSDYGGDPAKIKDLVRATIEVEGAADAQRAIADIFQQFDVLPTGQRNLLREGSEPLPGGYRDAKFNVRLPSGLVAEVQVSLPALLEAKKESHPLYVEAERLRREIAEAGVEDPSKAAQIAELMKKQEEIYAAAWTEATSARKADSSRGAPLRQADSASNGRAGQTSQATPYDGAAPAPTDTGMPSTSKNSAVDKNLAGSSEGKDVGRIETSDPILQLEKRTAELLKEQPDLMVRLDGMDEPVRLDDLMQQARAEAERDIADSHLVEVAATCFLGG